MKRILITGANSFIGTNVEKWLMKEEGKYYIETLDMKNDDWKEFNFSKFDVVLHVAGIAHIKEVRKNKKKYFKINRDLAIKTAEKAKKSGVKQFIFLSSMSVYGKNVGVITKETIPRPKTNYGKSKYEAEVIISNMMDMTFKVAILRPPIIYGNNSPGNYQRLQKLSLMLPIYPKINNKRSMLHVDKLAEFINCCIELDKSGVFLPQDDKYANTTKIIDETRILHGKKKRSSRIINPFIYILYPFSKTIRKIFGNLYYEK